MANFLRAIFITAMVMVYHGVQTHPTHYFRCVSDDDNSAPFADRPVYSGGWWPLQRNPPLNPQQAPSFDQQQPQPQQYGQYGVRPAAPSSGGCQCGRLPGGCQCGRNAPVAAVAPAPAAAAVNEEREDRALMNKVLLQILKFLEMVWSQLQTKADKVVVTTTATVASPVVNATGASGAQQQQQQLAQTP